MSWREWALVGAGAGVAVLAVRLFLRCRVRYRIGRAELRFELFGRVLRRIPYGDIDRVSKPRRRHGRLGYENWSNTLFDDHREVVLHLRRGWRRRVLLTPSNRYEFRRRLESAIAESGVALAAPAPDEAQEAEEQGSDAASTGRR